MQYIFGEVGFIAPKDTGHTVHRGTFSPHIGHPLVKFKSQSHQIDIYFLGRVTPSFKHNRIFVNFQVEGVTSYYHYIIIHHQGRPKLIKYLVLNSNNIQ